MKTVLTSKRPEEEVFGLEALEFLERSREMASEPVVATPVAFREGLPDEPATPAAKLTLPCIAV